MMSRNSNGCARLHTILFDLDGILISTPGMHDRALNAALQEIGYTVEQHVGEEAITSVEKLRRLGIVDPDEVQRVKQVKNRLFVEDINSLIFDPSLPINLAILRDTHKIALCTNSTKSSALKMLEHVGIADSFDCVLTQEDITFPKPEPDIYNTAMGVLGADPMTTIIFEDSEPGFTAACRSRALFPIRTDYKSMNIWLNSLKTRKE